MSILGLKDDKPLGKRKVLVNPHPYDGLGEMGVTGDGDMYEPVFGRMVNESGGGGSTTTKMTDAQKKLAAENAIKTKATFDAMQAEVDAKAKAVAQAQQTAKNAAIAKATAEGKSQAEIDKAAKAAITKVALENPIIVGSTPSVAAQQAAQKAGSSTVVVTPAPTGPMIVVEEKKPDLWDGLLEFKTNWDKGWNDFITGVKKTLNIK
jgi:hypothetical protein